METMTVIGIMTIIMLMVTQIYAVSYDVFIKHFARTENENAAVLAARTIADVTRGATEVLAGQTINGTPYVTSADTLVVKMPTVDSSGNIVSGSHDYLAIYRHATDATQIRSNTDAAADSRRLDGDRLVTDFNDTLKFRYNHSDVTKASRVQIYIINTQTKRTTALTARAWSAMFLRNR